MKNIEKIIANLYSIENIHLTGVYKISCKHDNSIYYIGSATKSTGRNFTKGFYCRWQKHFYELEKGTHHSNYLQNVFNKYGHEGLIIEVLKVCDTLEECILEEQKLIDLLNPKMNTLKIANSSLGYKHTKETINKMSKQRKGKRKEISIETRRKMSQSAKLRDLSYLRTKEVLLKKSLSLKGKKFPIENYQSRRRAVYQYNKEGQFVKYFLGTTLAAIETGIDYRSIANCAAGKRKTAGGYVWSRESKEKGIQSKPY